MASELALKDKNKRPKRLEDIENVAVTDKSGQRFEKPDPRLIELLIAAEPRIHYFGVIEGKGIGGLVMKHVFRLKEKLAIPDDYIRLALAEQILKDFPDKDIHVRGTKTSLNGSIPTKDGGTILDVEDLISTGEEFDRGWTRATRIETNPVVALNKVSADYALYAHAFREGSVDDPTGQDQKSIFPAVIVYDSTQLVVHDERQIEIPPNSDPILAVYLLDCPL